MVKKLSRLNVQDIVTLLKLTKDYMLLDKMTMVSLEMEIKLTNIIQF